MLELFFHSITGATIATPTAWLNQILFQRIEELLAPERLEVIDKDPDRASLFIDKTKTAIGTLNLGAAEPRRNGEITSVLAAPNGYEDQHDGNRFAWSTLVGAGGENVPHAMQNEELIRPPLPAADCLTVTGAGANRYRSHIADVGVPTRRDDLLRVRKLQESQSTGNARERREVSAARAVWEMVLRQQLTL
jgi:hypothetical protein